jgi:hypothetical protein
MLLVVASLLGACSSAPPQTPDDVCAMFEERPGWYDDARDAREAWGLPIHVGMAFVHRESSYVSDARPPRETLLWVIPWLRPSSAYGYAQATNEAWQDYRQDTKRILANRASFEDAIDFIGWYNQRSSRQLGIAMDDPYHLYVAYYAGPTGYRRGAWRGNAQVQGYAQKVANRADRYRSQLARCEDDLDRGFFQWLF